MRKLSLSEVQCLAEEPCAIQYRVSGGTDTPTSKAGTLSPEYDDSFSNIGFLRI